MEMRLDMETAALLSQDLGLLTDEELLLLPQEVQLVTVRREIRRLHAEFHAEVVALRRDLNPVLVAHLQSQTVQGAARLMLKVAAGLITATLASLSIAKLVGWLK